VIIFERDSGRRVAEGHPVEADPVPQLGRRLLGAVGPGVPE
jgi:hypothetical protein